MWYCVAFPQKRGRVWADGWAWTAGQGVQVRPALSAESQTCRSRGSLLSAGHSEVLSKRWPRPAGAESQADSVCTPKLEGGYICLGCVRGSAVGQPTMGMSE